MKEWEERGGTVERGRPPAARPPAVAAGPARAAAAPRPALAARASIALIERLASRSFGSLLLTWLWMVLGVGLVEWAASLAGAGALLEADRPLGADLHGLSSAIYFSFVTATSLGFGDVVPVGPLRLLSVLEGGAGLLLFGCVISKLVSRRQEELIEEIHHIAFEDRLGRVRTNLHLSFTELQSIASACDGTEAPLERIVPRLESAAVVFSGEMRAIHDLLFRPQTAPDESVIEELLANVAAGLGELASLLERRVKGPPRSASLSASVESIRRLAGEICGECVPRDYAPRLKGWMDRVQDLARRLPSA